MASPSASASLRIGRAGGVAPGFGSAATAGVSSTTGMSSTTSSTFSTTTAVSSSDSSATATEPSSASRAAVSPASTANSNAGDGAFFLSALGSVKYFSVLGASSPRSSSSEAIRYPSSFKL